MKKNFCTKIESTVTISVQKQKTRNLIRICPDAVALDKISNDMSFVYLEDLIPDEFMWQILFILFKVTMFVRMHTFEKSFRKLHLLWN